ncbi:MAG TPA: extracellular solute-binding protein [Thermoanaerobaculia bacterium]|nr:extracellular solute-binding protein [Thermoanaerobaculia bacterium]
MRGRARRLARAGLLCLALGPLGCGDGRTPLVVYSPHGRDLLTLVEDAFEAEHREIDLRFLDMGSQEVLDRIRSERANPQADVWFGGPSTLFARAAAEGLIAAYRPPWISGVPAAHRVEDDAYAVLYLTPTLIVYNRDAVAAAEAPGDWDDLLDARWRDQVLIRDPLASGTMRTIFGALISRAVERTGSPDEGFEWLRRLDAQTREYVHNPTLLHEKIVRREGLVTMWEMTDILNLIGRGAPLAYRFPASGAPVIEDSIAVVAGARRADEARRFVDWAGSPEALSLAAEKAYRLPASEELGGRALPEWVAEVRATLVPEPVDWDRLGERGAEWMATWDRTVRGRGK